MNAAGLNVTPEPIVKLSLIVNAAPAVLVPPPDKIRLLYVVAIV